MKISVSIVSHNQADIASLFIDDLIKGCEENIEILFTSNVPEDLSRIERYDPSVISIIKNDQAKGYGENHNYAFHKAAGEVYVVANPDVRYPAPIFDCLLSVMKRKNISICAPMVRSAHGDIEDSARPFPTPISLLRRRLVGEPGVYYESRDGPTEVDWIAGMFMVFTRDIFEKLEGFDERYFMYMEDVDICRRASELGYGVYLIPEVSVMHNARRDSRKKIIYRYWHLKSALKYFAKYRV